MENQTHETTEVVLQDLLQQYGKETVQELDCAVLKDNDFERLGDAAMETIRPGAAHEQMDAMMGGEGSQSLRLMHQQMGSTYLGCTSNASTGYGMMGGMMSGVGGMMGAYGKPYGNAHVWAGSLLYVLTIAVLIALIRYLWIKGGEKK